MINVTKVPARQKLSLTAATADALRAAGALIVDDRRRRSFFFDGRFLTARDLTREQTYFLTRQSDLGRAGGVGVVTGLTVAAGTTATTIALRAGHGVTPGGELVVVPGDLELDLARIAEIERLDAAFGLASIPRPSARSRTGLYVLALRPVEFTANPIASYPTTFGGARTIEDGDIVEAVAVTLIPYPEQTSHVELDEGRARAAREIFSSDGVRGVPVDALPLAMIALDHGIVQWVDMFLVRREVGASPLDVVGVGAQRRALREAYLLQYQEHLSDVLSRPGAARRFAASEHFFSLPPAGPMPAAAIDAASFTQIFFPPEIDVSLAAIPEDELAPLVEESLMLPPIDLTLSGDDLAWTSVLVLVPVPRDVLRRTAGAPVGSGIRLPAPSGGGGTRRGGVGSIGTIPGRFNLRPELRGGGRGTGDIVVNLDALRGALDLIDVAKLGALLGPNSISVGSSLAEPAWRDLLSRVDPLWYVRRRNLPYKAEVVGQGLDAPVINVDREGPVLARLSAAGLDGEYQEIKANAPADVLAEVLLMLSTVSPTPRVLLLAGAAHAVRAAMGKDALTHGMVVDVAARFTDPDRGGGLARLEDAFPDARTQPWALAIARATYAKEAARATDVVLDLDALAARRADLKPLIDALQGLPQPPQPEAVAALVGAELKKGAP
ncbi:hypothetical protein [Sorangium sp. So ce388]|uniref:hypothetical protein n=1 Tax=Sorangium sp. So ce388 TaxID=3133309 RepID=UPI003F5B25CA